MKKVKLVVVASALLLLVAGCGAKKSSCSYTDEDYEVGSMLDPRLREWTIEHKDDIIKKVDVVFYRDAESEDDAEDMLEYYSDYYEDIESETDGFSAENELDGNTLVTKVSVDYETSSVGWDSQEIDGEEKYSELKNMIEFIDGSCK